MSILLVQSCSKSKNRPGKPVKPLELYSGYFFKIIKKAIREGEFQDTIDICVLSAEHGLVDATDKIAYYDRRMTVERATDLRPDVTAELRSRVTAHEYDHVIFNLGAEYRHAVGDLSDLRASVRYIDGEGIGQKGHALKRVVRDGESALETEVKNATVQAD
ncbi:hypothetical protein HTZ84_21130 [Haloterrigena sp. SYSU A558-1]|uniref:DUF6884 domain-containing protein n=1 Tax=Haloterrigena gelatinilytica TaxID=2741724 RepID=A0ABX2LEU1_9EURY|nr:DUF6884 domain-containing protein [Haloterrigena gelatinilytica]NUC74769.1 hypothetical protein [Haloterrigena gelatinilytica]